MLTLTGKRCPPSMPLADRLRVYTSAIPNERGCFEWVGAIDSSGYGQITYKNVGQLVHRAWYETEKDVSLTSAQCVCHTCDNRKCCNVDHMFIGTQDDNQQDRLVKERYRRQDKLSASLVREIRNRYANENITMRALGEHYGVAPSVICEVVSRKSHAWVT